MRRKSILCAVGFAVWLFAGCSSKNSQMEYIGVEEAKRLALEDAGMPAAEVEFTAADLASRSGTDYYQVDFTAAGEQYKYDIDALTGVVIQASAPQGGTDAGTDAAADAGADDAAADTGTDAGTAAGTDTAAAVPDADADSAGQDSGQTMLTDKEAKAAALKHARLSAKDVTFAKCRLDYDDGRSVYDVEFYTKDYKEYDYEIDAYSGKVISYDYDMESSVPSAGGSKTISADKARKLALAQVPGASADDIWEFSEDYEDGRMVYEGKVIYNGMEYEFEIDAYSGSFRSWEAEPLDD